MKIKGFTLIELLAVIVILAIIALIAIPMISKIIDKTEDSAVLRSAELYIDGVNQAIMRANLTDKVRPKECEIQEDGNLICDGEYEIKIEATGTKPIAGTLVIEDRRVKSFIEMVIDIYELEMNENGKIVIKSTIEDSDEPENIKYASSQLLEKANDETITIYSTGNIHEMYTFNHEATEQTEALTDYRYIGNDPYNYVTFNNETWRIIGVFTVEDKDGNKNQNIKIIKDSFLNDRYPWNDSSGDNDWYNSSLKNYLNSSYYNVFDDNAKEMVEDVKYYLGGAVSTTITSAENWYTYERGTNIYNKNSVNWIGKVGLMYPSDYAYIYAYGIDDTCYSTGSCYINGGGNPSLGWLYNSANYWTIIAPSNTSTCAFGLGAQGYVYNLTAGSGIRDKFYVRPVLYLTSSVKISGGVGQQTNPYTLEIN